MSCACGARWQICSGATTDPWRRRSKRRRLPFRHPLRCYGGSHRISSDLNPAYPVAKGEAQVCPEGLSFTSPLFLTLLPSPLFPLLLQLLDVASLGCCQYQSFVEYQSCGGVVRAVADEGRMSASHSGVDCEEGTLEVGVMI